MQCVTEKSRRKADLKKEENLSALANAAFEQRKNPGEPLDGFSEIGFSRKWRKNHITFFFFSGHITFIIRVKTAQPCSYFIIIIGN